MTRCCSLPLLFALRFLLGCDPCIPDECLNGPKRRSHQPRLAEVRRWADAQAVQHNALREKLREIDDGYEVLFIPGFMGSRLEFPGFTYGVDAIQPDSLMGNRSPNKVGILLDFNAGGRIR